jgi:hypothetical protein
MTPSQIDIPVSDMPRQRDVARIEELVRDLSDESGTLNALLREHFDAARFYLLGSMPHEYGLELRLAKDRLPDIEDENLRARVAEFLRSQDAA